MRLRVALRYGMVREADGTHNCVVALGGIFAFRPGMPAPQPICAALFLLGMLIALPEVRFFALISVPAGVAIGLALYGLRRWRSAIFRLRRSILSVCDFFSPLKADVSRQRPSKR